MSQAVSIRALPHTACVANLVDGARKLTLSRTGRLVRARGVKVQGLRTSRATSRSRFVVRSVAPSYSDMRSSSGSAVSYERVEECLVYPATGRAKGVIHFIGGAPDVVYR